MFVSTFSFGQMILLLSCYCCLWCYWWFSTLKSEGDIFFNKEKCCFKFLLENRYQNLFAGYSYIYKYQKLWYQSDIKNTATTVNTNVERLFILVNFSEWSCNDANKLGILNASKIAQSWVGLYVMKWVTWST